MEPSFDAVAMVLEIDCRMLFLQDSRGHVPLSYVREDQWSKWIHFLDIRKEEFWPKRNTSMGEERDPTLAKLRPNSRPIHDPMNALPIKLVTMVAAGTIKPDEVEYLLKNDNLDKSNNSSYSSGCSSSDNDDDDMDEDDSESIDESEDHEDDSSECSLDLLLSSLPIRPRSSIRF